MSGLLLDTNVALWLVLGDRGSVSARATEALQDPGNEVAVSAVSVWEIAIKRSLGKLSIADGWARELRRLTLTPMPITAEHAQQVEQLPWHHRDPFDRLLVAQAQLERRCLVTADARLADYDVEVLW
ncbi:MAG: type II toxin-antitoxin system VapC family toxin [Solirubrobacterales bacterium]